MYALYERFYTKTFRKEFLMKGFMQKAFLRNVLCNFIEVNYAYGKVQIWTISITRKV